MTKRKTTECFKEEIYEINRNIEMLGKYKNNSTPIAFRCKICDHSWSPRPCNLLKGSGCPKCGRVLSSDKQRKTTEVFIKELKQANPNIELIGEYKGALEKATFKCKICDYEWSMSSPCKLVTRNKTGCPKCAGQERKTLEVFIEEMKEVHNDKITVLKFVSTQVPARLKCNICDRDWESLPSNCLYGSKGC